MLVRICSKVNDDNMLKDPSLRISMEKIKKEVDFGKCGSRMMMTMMKYKGVGLSGLSNMWPTDPYNLPHLCSRTYKILLSLRNTIDTYLWNTENIFACQRPVC